MHAESNPSSIPVQLLRFKEDNADKLSLFTSTLEQALESIKANIKWVATNKDQVLQWFLSETSSSV